MFTAFQFYTLMPPSVFHVKGGFGDGFADLSAAQGAIERALRSACGSRFIFESKSYEKAEFIELLRTAARNSIIYYDGHGTPDGNIILADGNVSGDEIRSHRVSAFVFLHCCFSVKIATANPDVEDNLRNKVATLLAVGGGNIRSEVDAIMHLIAAEHAQMEDNADIAKRIAVQIRTLGLDRFGLVYGGICPLSIGIFNTGNDAIITNVVTALLDLLLYI